MWDHLQAQLHCCGVDGYQDFDKLPKWNSTNKIVPESCCVLDDVKTFKPKSPFCTSAPNVTNSYADQVNLVTEIIASNCLIPQMFTVSGMLPSTSRMAKKPHGHCYGCSNNSWSLGTSGSVFRVLLV